MNKVDKFDVDLEFFFYKFILRKKDDKLLDELLFTFNETKPHVTSNVVMINLNSVKNSSLVFSDFYKQSKVFVLDAYLQVYPFYVLKRVLPHLFQNLAVMTTHC